MTRKYRKKRLKFAGKKTDHFATGELPKNPHQKVKIVNNNNIT